MIEEERNQMEIPVRIIRPVLATSLYSFGVLKTTDVTAPEIEHYVAIMTGEGRNFHSLFHVCRCLQIASEISDLFSEAQKKLLIAALLFQRSGYKPGDRGSAERSRNIAMTFYAEPMYDIYPRGLRHELNRFIKATYPEKYLHTRFGDERDYVADIVQVMWSLPWDEFRKAWSKVLLEFQHAGYSPVKFKRFSKRLLDKMLGLSRMVGIYRTQPFDKYEDQARENIKRLRAEIG